MAASIRHERQPDGKLIIYADDRVLGYIIKQYGDGWWQVWYQAAPLTHVKLAAVPLYGVAAELLVMKALHELSGLGNCNAQIVERAVGNAYVDAVRAVAYPG